MSTRGKTLHACTDAYVYIHVTHREDFKRIAEETTLLLTQQLLEHRLEGRPDVPAHYESVAMDMIRAALPPGVR